MLAFRLCLPFARACFLCVIVACDRDLFCLFVLCVSMCVFAACSLRGRLFVLCLTAYLCVFGSNECVYCVCLLRCFIVVFIWLVLCVLVRCVRFALLFDVVCLLSVVCCVFVFVCCYFLSVQSCVFVCVCA